MSIYEKHVGPFITTAGEKRCFTYLNAFKVVSFCKIAYNAYIARKKQTCSPIKRS